VIGVQYRSLILSEFKHKLMKVLENKKKAFLKLIERGRSKRLSRLSPLEMNASYTALIVI
jgi:hypothetical protein